MISGLLDLILSTKDLRSAAPARQRRDTPINLVHVLPRAVALADGKFKRDLTGQITNSLKALSAGRSIFVKKFSPFLNPPAFPSLRYASPTWMANGKRLR